MKNRTFLVLPCLFIFAAGAWSCSGGSDSEKLGVDAADAVKRGDALPFDEREAGAPGLDATGPDAEGLEATLPMDAGVDQATIAGDSAAGTSEAGVVLDTSIRDDVPQVVIHDGGSVGHDATIDTATKDTNAPEARNPDTAVPDTAMLVSPPDAAQVDVVSADASTPDTNGVAMDATADSPLAKLDTGPASCGRIKCDCTFNGIKLWGNVREVTSFPDIRVRVSSFPDLNVKETSIPTRCGEWHMVSSLGDFTVQFVTASEDVAIAYSSFPGIP